MIISSTFEQAFLDFMQILVEGNAKDLSLAKINEEEWIVITTKSFLFEDNDDATPACIFKIMKKLFKYPDLGNIKEINLYYNMCTKEYDYDIAITF